MTASCLASFVYFDAFSKLQWNGSALLCYAIIISVQKLTQMIKPNSTDLLRRKNEVDEILIKIFDKDLKTAINNLKSNYGKYIRDL